MRETDSFTAFLLDILRPLGAVSARRMFGGTGLYHGTTMFGLVAREALFLKVGDANRADYQASGQAPFSYPTKNGTNTITSYWSCPPELLDDPDALCDWARKAVGAAAMAAASKPRRDKKRRREGAG